MTTGEAAYAVQSTVDPQCEEAMQSGQWVGKVVQDLLMAFTNASLLHSKLRTLGIPVDDVATVDVHGMCIYASPSMYMVFICHSYIV